MYKYPHSEEEIKAYTDGIVARHGNTLFQMYKFVGFEEPEMVADALLRNAEIDPDCIGCENILDIGCGSCALLNAVQSLALHAPCLFGINYHECQLKYANEGIDVSKGDAEKLPYGDNSMDIVFMTYMLGHMPDPLKALKEAYRVLDKGGKLIYWDVVRTYSGVKEYLQYQLFLKSQVVWWARGAGFRDKRSIDLTMSGPEFTSMFESITSDDERRVIRQVMKPCYIVFEKVK